MNCLKCQGSRMPGLKCTCNQGRMVPRGGAPPPRAAPPEPEVSRVVDDPAEVEPEPARKANKPLYIWRGQILADAAFKKG